MFHIVVISNKLTGAIDFSKPIPASAVDMMRHTECVWTLWTWERGIENCVKDSVCVCVCLLKQGFCDLQSQNTSAVQPILSSLICLLLPSGLSSIWISDNGLYLINVYFLLLLHFVFSSFSFSLPWFPFSFNSNTYLFCHLVSSLSFLCCFCTGSSFLILLSGCWGLQFLAVPINLSGCLTLVEFLEQLQVVFIFLHNWPNVNVINVNHINEAASWCSPISHSLKRRNTTCNLAFSTAALSFTHVCLLQCLQCSIC